MDCKRFNESTHRTEAEKKYLEIRLKTIEGQVRGVAKMVAENKYCNDILIQLLAINKSLKSLNKKI